MVPCWYRYCAYVGASLEVWSEVLSLTNTSYLLPMVRQPHPEGSSHALMHEPYLMSCCPCSACRALHTPRCQTMGAPM